jgi:hypothetical protein
MFIHSGGVTDNDTNREHRSKPGVWDLEWAVVGCVLVLSTIRESDVGHRWHLERNSGGLPSVARPVRVEGDRRLTAGD